MFGDEDYSKESFKGTLTAYGNPISVTETGRVAAMRSGVEPTVFYFYGSNGRYSISLGRTDEGKGVVGMETEGYLRVKQQGIEFYVSDGEGAPLANTQSSGEKVVFLVGSTENADVLLFGGADLFDWDVDARFNFLNAAHKVKHETIDKSVYYFAPTGDGTWTKYTEDQPHFSKAAPFVLTVV